MTQAGRGTSAAAPRRLLVLLEQVRTSGMVRQLLEALERLPARGVAPLLATVVRDTMDVNPIREECHRRGIQHALVSEAARFDPGTVRQVHDLIEEWKPHAIQTHGYKSSTLAYLVKRRREIPWIAFYHGRTTTDLKVRLYHAIERRLLGRADRIVAVAEGVEDHFLSRDRARIEVIPNGVIPGWADRRAARPDAERRVLGFVGRLSSEKGCDLFLETLAALRADLPALSGTVIGDGPERERLEDTAERLGLTGHVRFAGWVDDMAAEYDAMDALVISSRSEVFPNVLLEAVLTGLPVAATPAGGIPGVAHGLASVHVAAGHDPECLARAVRAVLDVREEQLDAAEKEVRRRYDQGGRADRLARIVLELATGGTAAAAEPRGAQPAK